MDPALMVNVVANHHAHTDLVTGEGANMEIAFLGNVRMMTAMVAFAHIKIVLAVAATAVVREAPVSMIGVLMASVTTFTTTV